MIYAWIGSFIAALAIGAYGGYQWESGRWAQEQAKRLEAEAREMEKGRELAREIDNHQIDVEAALEAGKASAKTVYVKVAQRGASDVAIHPVFSNRACDWPPSVVLLVNSAFANLRSPADTAVPAATLPAPAPAAGGPAGSNLPVAPQPAGAVVPLSDDARTAGGSGPLPAAGTGKPPKPVPRKVAP